MIEQYKLFEFTEYTNPPNSPKQLEIKEIGAKFACELNSKWHSRLPIIDWSNVVRNTYYICFGAIYNNDYYAVGIWSSPVAQNRFKDGKNILELRRLAINELAPKYTATRMISQMVKIIYKNMKNINRLISYQDVEVHSGTIYKASNWFIAQTTEGISWTTKNRKRNIEQTLSNKIRWEYKLR